jgi:hypothetical protein
MFSLVLKSLSRSSLTQHVHQLEDEAGAVQPYAQPEGSLAAGDLRVRWSLALWLVAEAAPR